MALEVGVNCYRSRADAITYFTDLLHGADFLGATDTKQDQALITATKMLDRQEWVGTKTEDSQDLDWPRTGVSDPEGNAVASDAVPQCILDATCELALALIQDLTVQTSSDTSENIKSLKAGSAEIQYFKGARGPRFPTIIHELIWFYLATTSSYTAPYYGATEAETGLDDHELSGGY